MKLGKKLIGLCMAVLLPLGCLPLSAEAASAVVKELTPLKY